MTDLLLHSSRRRFLALGGAFALAACTTTDAPRPTFAPIRFRGRPAFRLNVERVEIAHKYQAPGRLPNIDHILTNSPASVMTAWAEDRLEAGGQPGGAIAVYSILDGSIVEKELPKTQQGLQGVFTRAQAFQYDGHLAVELIIRSPQGMSDGMVRGEVRTTRTLHEDATETERQTLWNDMVQAMASEVAGQLERNLPVGFNRYILY